MRKSTYRQKDQYNREGWKREWMMAWFSIWFRVLEYKNNSISVIELRDKNGDPSDYTHKDFRILFEETQYKVTDVYQPTSNVFRLTLEIDKE